AANKNYGNRGKTPELDVHTFLLGLAFAGTEQLPPYSPNTNFAIQILLRMIAARLVQSLLGRKFGNDAEEVIVHARWQRRRRIVAGLKWRTLALTEIQFHFGI